MSIKDIEHYNGLSAGSHAHVVLECDSGKNKKCLGIFSREKRAAVKQRARIGNKDYCKFCQKTEEYSGRNNPNAKYVFDDLFFSNIDTKEKAYILGWIASDGSLGHDGKISISIRDYDVEVLHIIRNLICAALPIVEAKENMVTLTICSTQMVKDVCRHLGLASPDKKDLDIKYPILDKDLHQYFIRGYFEGDGSISLKDRVPVSSISSNSTVMLEEIRKVVGFGSIYMGTYKLEFNGTQTVKFVDYIYNENLYLSLDRKLTKCDKARYWKPTLPGKYGSLFTNHGTVKFSKTRLDAITPTLSESSASGIDLHIIEKVKDFNTDVTLYTTGIKVCPPPGYYFLLVGRSSISKSGYSLANGIGIIDDNYTGEIMVALRNHTDDQLILPSKLVQLVLTPKITPYFVEVTKEEWDAIEDTERGTGGFGSTG